MMKTLIYDRYIWRGISLGGFIMMMIGFFWNLNDVAVMGAACFFGPIIFFLEDLKDSINGDSRPRF